MKLYFLRPLIWAGITCALSVVNTGCKKGNANDDIDMSKTPRTNITADLSGASWFGLDEANMDTSLNFTLAVYNPASGIWFNNAPTPWDMQPRPGNGFRFTADGEFEFCRFSSSGMGGLKSNAFDYIKGTAEQHGGEIVLHPVIHRGWYHSTSDPTLDYNKDFPRDVIKINYATHRYTNGWDHVDVQWNDGSTTRYYRHYY